MNNIYKNIFILIVLFTAVPSSCFAKVRINEIAWMGTDVSGSGNDEWIELFNDGVDEADMSGWKLVWGGGNTIITFDQNLSGTKNCKNTKIATSGFYFLKRTSDVVYPDIKADCIYTGAMTNGGEIITLRDANNPYSEIDSIVGVGTKKGTDDIWKIGGGEAGSNKTKNTAQFTVSGWITATGTPKALNENIPPEQINDSVATSTDSTETTSKSIETEAPINPVISYSSHSSPIELSQPAEKIKVSLAAGRNRISLSGSPVIFGGKFTDDLGRTMSGGSFNWSFGDGASASGQQVVHDYDLPGEYINILNANYGGDEYVGRSIMKIVEPNFEVKGEKGVLYIANKLANEVNLKNWKVSNGSRSYIFTNDTIILAGKNNPFTSKILGFGIVEGDKVELISPSGKVVANFLLPKKQRIAQNSEQLPYQGPSLTVDKGVDNVGTSTMRAELATLEDKLKELQNSMIANVLASDGEAVVKKTIASKKVIIAEGTNKETKATTSGKVIIKLEAQNKEYAVWTFFKKIFYH